MWLPGLRASFHRRDAETRRKAEITGHFGLRMHCRFANLNRRSGCPRRPGGLRHFRQLCDRCWGRNRAWILRLVAEMVVAGLLVAVSAVAAAGDFGV